MITKIYKYGLRPPVEGEDIVNEQMLMAHRYYNKLIEIECESLTTNRETVKERQQQLRLPEIEELEEKVKELKGVLQERTSEIKKWRIQHGKQVAPKEIRDQLKEAKAQRKVIGEELKKVKKVLYEDPVVIKKHKKANEQANRLRKDARASCGCYWGTYLTVEQASDAAREDAKFLPHFRRWDGSGAVAVQVQHGITFEKAMEGDDTRLP